MTFGSSHSFPRVMDRHSKIVASVIAAYWYLRHHISYCWIIVVAIINNARSFQIIRYFGIGKLFTILALVICQYTRDLTTY